MAVIKRTKEPELGEMDGKYQDNRKEAEGGSFPSSLSKILTPVTTDWAAKDRSQLVGGRSHDAASLVNTALVTGTKLEVVLDMYTRALRVILNISESVK